MKNKFTSHKQHLFGLLFSGSPKKTHTDQSMLQVLLLFLKRNNSQTFKSVATAKTFSVVSILLVQLASTNYFYSIRQMENVFQKCLLLP